MPIRPLISLAAKDLRLLVRDWGALFFTFVFPVIYAVFFGTIYARSGGGSSAIDIVAVDEDRTPASAQFIADLSTGDAFEVSTAPDRAAAEKLVLKGDRAAYVAVTKGFGQASDRIFWGEPMTLVVGTDPSKKAESGMIQGLLTERAYRRMQAAMTDPTQMQAMSHAAMDAIRTDNDMNPAARAALEPFLGSVDKFFNDLPKEDTTADGSSGSYATGGFNPVKIEVASVAGEQINPFAITFAQGVVWGIMGAAAGFGISLVTERTRGTLMRLRCAPIRRWQVLAGKGLACFLTTIGVAIVMLILGATVFHFRPQSPGLLAVALLCSSIGFVGVMMLISVLGRTEGAAGGAGWAILLVMAMVGGGMIPQMFLPAWILRLAAVSPVKWAIHAIDGAVWRGFSPEQMVLPCAVLVGIGIAGFAVGAWIFARREGG